MRTAKQKLIDSFEKRRGRKLVIDGVNWKFFVGQYQCVMYSENGDRYSETIYGIKGISSMEFERGQYKKSLNGALMPKEICDWIKKQLTN